MLVHLLFVVYLRLQGSSCPRGDLFVVGHVLGDFGELGVDGLDCAGIRL